MPSIKQKVSIRRPIGLFIRVILYVKSSIFCLCSFLLQEVRFVRKKDVQLTWACDGGYGNYPARCTVNTRALGSRSVHSEAYGHLTQVLGKLPPGHGLGDVLPSCPFSSSMALPPSPSWTKGKVQFFTWSLGGGHLFSGRKLGCLGALNSRWNNNKK